MKQTKSTKIKDVTREWVLFDVKDQILGRTASDIALVLMGKNKANFVRNLDLGDYVVVINAKEVKVTGNKETLKKYYRHSGYPGGFRMDTYKELKTRNPEEIIRHAVAGMLPQNKLKAKMLKRLYIFKEAEHTYGDKFNK